MTGRDGSRSRCRKSGGTLVSEVVGWINQGWRATYLSNVSDGAVANLELGNVLAELLNDSDRLVPGDERELEESKDVEMSVFFLQSDTTPDLGGVAQGGARGATAPDPGIDDDKWGEMTYLGHELSVVDVACRHEKKRCMSKSNLNQKKSVR